MFSNIFTVISAFVSVGIIIDRTLIETDPQREKVLLRKLLRAVSDFNASQFTLEILKRFNALFDSIYGPRHLTWKCVYRSVISSLIAIVLIITVTHVFGFRYSLGLFRDADSLLDVFLGFIEIFSRPLFFLVLLQNLFLDYISLAVTRTLLKSRYARTIRGLAVIVTLDFVISFLLVALPLGIEYLSFPRFRPGGYQAYIPGPDGARTFTDLISTFISGTGRKQIMVPLIASSFFTSAVFYAFTAVALAIYLLDKIRPSLKQAVEWLLERNRSATVLLAAAGAFLSLIMTLDKQIERKEQRSVIAEIRLAVPFLNSHPMQASVIKDKHARDVLLGRHAVQWDHYSEQGELQQLGKGTVNVFDEEGLLLLSGEINFGDNAHASLSGVVTLVDTEGFTLYGRVALQQNSEYFILDSSQDGMLISNGPHAAEYESEGARKEQQQYGGIRFSRGDISYTWCCVQMSKMDSYFRILFN
jgi:hypothetical protein